eukprot:13534672-Alexandrium_andersonii.AAC.1
MPVQFAPKGSYRLEHTAEYYDWILEGRVAREDGEPWHIVLADWFAPNLDTAFEACVEEKGGM